MPGRAIVVVFMAIAVLAAAELGVWAALVARTSRPVATDHPRRARAMLERADPDARRWIGRPCTRRWPRRRQARSAKCCVWHRRWLERRRRIAGSASPLLCDAARTSTGWRLHRAHACRLRRSATRNSRSRRPCSSSRMARGPLIFLPEKPPAVPFGRPSRRKLGRALRTYVTTLRADRLAADETLDVYRLPNAWYRLAAPTV